MLSRTSVADLQGETVLVRCRFPSVLTVVGTAAPSDQRISTSLPHIQPSSLETGWGSAAKAEEQMPSSFIDAAIALPRLPSPWPRIRPGGDEDRNWPAQRA